MTGFPPNRRSGRLFLVATQGAGGFTLFELLVAIAVFALLTTAMYGGLNSLLGNAESLSRSAVAYDSARSCLDRMARDLRSVYVAVPPAYETPGFDTDPDPYRFVANGIGQDVRMRFVAFSHVPLDRGLTAEAGRIVYYLYTPEGRDTRVLMRNDRVLQYDADTEEGQDPIVCENIASLDLLFYDGNGREYDRWDSDSSEFDYATPRAVGIQLVLDADGRRYPFETIVDLPVYREPVE
ncbi:hypothetical protein Dole_1035 [Desulfosudis oleivorans Hxd3]|uniref:Type II secretion system protein J n=1 Tax=Desulfosudis oleivorans (strain DSM 6200 / JCM 39069 / Hxd3) TaxID=96561 RepID=A8ZWY9_DESOH|nr:hypothetical protein Dole_1035 [Desulfosudis oleivorans Hxd3]